MAAENCWIACTIREKSGESLCNQTRGFEFVDGVVFNCRPVDR